MTVSLRLYAWLMARLHGFAPSLLEGRLAKGKEDAARWRERLGEAGRDRPAAPLVWVHGVSIGESVSALPVIERICRERPGTRVLVTTATTTSAEILAKRLPAGAFHQYAPVDTPQAVMAFLEHWQPDLAVFIESDIWPVMLGTLDARRIPRVLLSARITEKTFRGWQSFRTSMRALLGGYALVMAQDPQSDDRLKAMGVATSAQANLKTLGDALKVDPATLGALRALTDGRRTILAASTHYGEDTIITKALEACIRDGDLLILVPRHPVKAADIRLDIEAIGLHVAQRSLKEPVSDAIHVYLADTLGELGLFFALADIVIMGGSFLNGIGGHNPLEAARLGKSVITGGDTINWDGVYATLIAAGGGWQVYGPQELRFLVEQLRDNPAAISAADAAAMGVGQAQADTLARIWRALTPLLPGTETAHAS